MQCIVPDCVPYHSENITQSNLFPLLSIFPFVLPRPFPNDENGHSPAIMALPNFTAHPTAVHHPYKKNVPNAFVFNALTFPHCKTSLSQTSKEISPLKTLSNNKACIALCVVLRAICGRIKFKASPVIKTLPSRATLRGQVRSEMAVMKG